MSANPTSSATSNVGIGSFEAVDFDSSTFDPSRFGLTTGIVDEVGYGRSVERFRTQGISLPTFGPVSYTHLTLPTICSV